MGRQIRLELAGSHGSIDPRAVAESITELDKMLRHIASDEPGELAIADLSIGSAHVSLIADDQRIDGLRDGLEQLSAGARIPTGWGVESIRALIDLEHVSARRGVEAVRLRIGHKVREIDAELAQHARESIAPPNPSLGSVRGRLYRYNNRTGHRRAGLEDHETGHAIDVIFPDHLAVDVRSALEHEVEAWGEVQRDAADRVTTVHLVGIEVTDESRQAVTLDEVAGILGPRWTGGLDTAEWVRRQRG